ncbi:phospholipase C/P1 nuclease [Heliocybe sulcata]|uniref:Phospholipase C/P1 nuclease n=1 Tax=Heliocybe sulcata TaxID=5364 RepID=A0A5C3MW44_9AGAM|nr:phospholipase C/P1 nuclease [Heliocybe sulcata]
MKFHPVSALTLGVLSAVPGALGWGAAGHEIIATIAEIYLHPTVMPTICAILDEDAKPCHLSSIASWADRVRWQMRWSAPLHYVGAHDDHPSDHCAFPGERGWNGRAHMNVLGAIRNVSGILEDWVEAREPEYVGNGRASVGGEGDPTAAEALKFLVHFIGDMHMPLHLTGRERGGNGAKVTFDGRVTNLHSVWDNFLIAERIRSIPYNYTRPLPSREVESVLRGAIYDPYVRRLIWEGLGEGGRWRDEWNNWLECPATPAKDTVVKTWRQFFLGSTLSQLLSGSGIAEETDDDVLCPYHWAKPIHALNCKLIWPKALDELGYSDININTDSNQAHDCHGHAVEEEVGLLDDLRAKPKPHEPYLELDTPEYAGVVRREWIVERLLAMGGMRLAGTLNWLFADLSGEEVQSRPRLWAEPLRV